MCCCGANVILFNLLPVFSFILTFLWSCLHISFQIVSCLLLYGPRREKTCLWRFANNKGADQPAHLGSLIRSFVIRFLESIICKLATGEISIFQLVSAVIHLQFWAYGSRDSLFPISVSPNCKLVSPKHYF